MGKVFKKNISKPKAHWLMFFMLFALFALISCQSAPSQSNKENLISVILVDGKHFTVLENDSAQSNDNNEPNIAYIKRNSDITFLLSADNDYFPEKCSYEEHEFTQVDENVYSLRLMNIKYSLRFSVSFKTSQTIDPADADGIITYDPNGGTLLPGKDDVYPFITDHHPRPNTSIGTDIMYRDGYNLIGWNTEDDASGEHIGLGSRYLDVDNPDFTLYAEWSQYSEARNFEYTVDNENHVSITKYLGDEPIISIPEFIDDKQIMFIQENSFLNSNAKTIILPKSIQSIAKEAFINCAFEEIYLFDNIVSIFDDCFKNCPNLSTVHINAIEGARYVTADRNMTYADKVDRLILNKDKKKLIILGGSGAYYDVDACLLKRRHPNYEVFNLAVNGYFNGPVQMETIMKYMNEGDCLLHVVEMCGKFQLMTDISMCNHEDASGYDYRFFCALEQNFDIISLADIRHVTGFFDMFTVFNNAREKKPTIPYTEYTDYADERGDYMPSDKRIKIIPKDGGKSISNEGAILVDAIGDDGGTRLADYYNQLTNKGVSILFSYCPVNKDSLSEDDLNPANISEFDRRIHHHLSEHCRIVNNIESVLFDFEWFADTDWHLDYEHSLYFTDQLNSRLGQI